MIGSVKKATRLFKKSAYIITLVVLFFCLLFAESVLANEQEREPVSFHFGDHCNQLPLLSEEARLKLLDPKFRIYWQRFCQSLPGEKCDDYSSFLFDYGELRERQGETNGMCWFEPFMDPEWEYQDFTPVQLRPIGVLSPDTNEAVEAVRIRYHQQDLRWQEVKE